MKTSRRLSRALRPNRVHIGSVGADHATLAQLRLSCPRLTDADRDILLSGRGISRYFCTPEAASRFYVSIYGDDHPGWGFPRLKDVDTRRWDSGRARRWVPVYANLMLNGELLTENS